MQDIKTYLSVAPMLSTLVRVFSRFIDRNQSFISGYVDIPIFSF